MRVGGFVCDFYVKIVCLIFLEAALPDFHFPVQQFQAVGSTLWLLCVPGTKQNKTAFSPSSVRLHSGLHSANELVHLQSSENKEIVSNYKGLF